jgi:hypothetical protein
MSRNDTPTKRFTKNEIAQLEGDPTKQIPEREGDRSASTQIDALLKVTDVQVQNLEAAGTLSPQELRKLGYLADILATLVRAQRDANKTENEGFDATAEAKRRMEKKE